MNANLLIEHKDTYLLRAGGQVFAPLFLASMTGLYMHLFLSHKLIKVLHYSSDCIEKSSVLERCGYIYTLVCPLRGSVVGHHSQINLFECLEFWSGDTKHPMTSALL